VKIVEALLALDADANAPGNAGMTPLHEAGLDEGLLSLTLSDLLCMENPYSHKTFQ
jgi:hypothetical protein